MQNGAECERKQGNDEGSSLQKQGNDEGSSLQK